MRRPRTRATDHTDVVDHEGHVPSNDLRDLGVEAPGGPGEVVRYDSAARARELGLEVARQRLELRLVATHQHDGNAAFHEAARERFSEALRAPGHEGRTLYAAALSFEPQGARPSQETRRPAPQGDSDARAAVQKCEQTDAAQRRAGDGAQRRENACNEERQGDEDFGQVPVARRLRLAARHLDRCGGVKGSSESFVTKGMSAASFHATESAASVGFD